MIYYRALPIIGAAACLGLAITRSEAAPQVQQSMHSVLDRIIRKRKAAAMSRDEYLVKEEDETIEECEPAQDWLLLLPTRSLDRHVEGADERPNKRVRFSQVTVRPCRRYAEGISFARMPRYPKAPERKYVCGEEKLDDHVCWHGDQDTCADTGSTDVHQETRPAKDLPNGKHIHETITTRPASTATTASRTGVPPHVSRLLEIDRHLSDYAGIFANVPLPSALSNVEVEEGQTVG